MAVPDQLADSHVPPDRPRQWLSWELALIGATGLVPVCAAAVQAPGTVTAWLTLPVPLAVQWFVTRRGGWRLIGPHCYFDLIRMARKGRTILFRVLFLVALLCGIWYTHDEYRAGSFREPESIAIRRFVPAERTRESLRQEFARFNVECTNSWFLIQNVMILFLTPAYVGGAIAEERERRTLELLFTSALYSREIVLGKLGARLLHLGGFLLAGLPVFCIMLVWGGTDLTALVGGSINTLLLLIATGSVCLVISTMPFSSTTCVVISYATVLPLGICFLGAWQQSWRNSGGLRTADEWLPIAAGYGFVIPFCLLLAIKATRPHDQPHAPREAPRWHPARWAVVLADARSNTPVPMLMPVPSADATDLESWNPPLPPVQDNALLWKERYTGGRALVQTPEFLMLFAGSGGMVLILMAAVGAVATLRALYAFVLCCCVIGVAFRAAGCVVRERQLQTLDMLLLIPIDRSAILHAKWLGVILKGRLWLAVLAGDVILGLVIGVYHPFSAFCLLVLPCPLLLCVSSVGVLLSVIARTSLQANVVMAFMFAALTAALGYTAPGLLLGFNSLTFSWWDCAAIQIGDLSAALLTAGALLLVAWLAWGAATFIFEHTGRR